MILFIVKSKKESFSLNELYKLKETLKEIPISGMKNSSSCLKRGEEFLIITAGSAKRFSLLTLLMLRAR